MYWCRIKYNPLSDSAMTFNFLGNTLTVTLDIVPKLMSNIEWKIWHLNKKTNFLRVSIIINELSVRMIYLYV